MTSGLVKVDAVALETFEGQAKGIVTRVDNELAGMLSQAKAVLQGSWDDGGSEMFDQIHLMVNQAGVKGNQLLADINAAVASARLNALETEARAKKAIGSVQIG